jgi:hypothetical protein
VNENERLKVSEGDVVVLPYGEQHVDDARPFGRGENGAGD